MKEVGISVPKKMLGAHIFHNGQKFITHTTLSHRKIALRTLHTPQKLFLLTLFALIALLIFFFGLKIFLIGFIAVLAVFYFIDLLFNFFLIVNSFRKHSEVEVKDEEIAAIPDDLWPMYSIFCPLYKEWNVLPQFVKAMSNLDYPKDKMEVMLLLEEDDTKTIETAQKMNLPSYFRIVVVPNSQPKTKPKACNYGLAQARGEYIVIYDAEDVPDRNQLKKAILAFQRADKSVLCMQAKLNFYNPKQNLLTRVFTAEYSLWFDLILTGLQSIKAPIPLGGTSNHFRTNDLHLLEGWDPFNVTEDCDLGIRLFKKGYHTAIFNSTTLEEANSSYTNWFRQRSRWIKGYIQTYLVHMRRPSELIRESGNIHILTFQLVVGGKIASIFINPFMWITTASYFIFRPIIGHSIESLFPLPVLYISFLCLILGNFLYLYYYMIGCSRREHWGIMEFVFLVPIYWLMMSVAAWMGMYQLIFKPHYWEKTHHGLHLKTMSTIPSLELATAH